jgi:microsomal dipeptidase-like Zn-dependent dipeptidase
LPADACRAEQCANIIAALQARGSSPAETAGIKDANFLRAFTATWGS